MARKLTSSFIESSGSDPIKNLLNLDEKPKVHSADRIRGLINNGSKARLEGAAARKRTMLESLREKKVSDDYVKQMPRRWRTGEVYAPHDLSPLEMEKWRRQKTVTVDVVDLLGINPLDHYRVCFTGIFKAFCILILYCRTSQLFPST